MSWVARVIALSPSIMVDADPAPLRVCSAVRARIETGQGWWPDARRECCGEPAHPGRPHCFHHPRPDEKRVADLQQAAERLEGGHGPQHHHKVLLVALPRTAVQDLMSRLGRRAVARVSSYSIGGPSAVLREWGGMRGGMRSLSPGLS